MLRLYRFNRTLTLLCIRDRRYGTCTYLQRSRYGYCTVRYSTVPGTGTRYGTGTGYRYRYGTGRLLVQMYSRLYRSYRFTGAVPCCLASYPYSLPLPPQSTHHCALTSLTSTPTSVAPPHYRTVVLYSRVHVFQYMNTRPLFMHANGLARARARAPLLQ